MVALIFCAGSAAAIPVAPADLAQVSPDIAPDVADLHDAASLAADEPFRLKAVPAKFGLVVTKWSGVQAEIVAEREILARCRASAERCPAAAQNFLAIVDDGRAHTGLARIGVINRAVNMAIIPISDLVQWGVPDRWSAPLQTFTTGRGDCEDYAIAKYVALIEAGVSRDDVKLLIVRNLAANDDHAVLAVRLDGRWIVLDNRWLALVEDNDMRHVLPLFVLDDAGVREFLPTMMADEDARDGSAAAPTSLPSR